MPIWQRRGVRRRLPAQPTSLLELSLCRCRARKATCQRGLPRLNWAGEPGREQKERHLPHQISLSAVSGVNVAQPEIGAVRVALESMATERAAQHVTPADIEETERLADEAETARLAHDMKLYLAKNQEFHFRIYRSAPTLILMPIIESLWLQIGPVQALHTDAGISFGSECHYMIINALREHDSHAARQAMAEDIDMGIRYLRANALFFEV